MIQVSKSLLRALGRLFPSVSSNAQAIAFNLFVSFFPVMLLMLGIVGTSKELSAGVLATLQDLRWVLPPGSRQLVTEFLLAQSRKSGTLLTLGAGGTLFTGAQVMTGFLGAFRQLYDDKTKYSFLMDQARGLVLVLVALVPLFCASLLTVFGPPVRTWMVRHFGLPGFFMLLWTVVYVSLALVLAVLVLSLLYRLGCRSAKSFNDVLPGAVVATGLWWVVNTAFGIYVRRVPYNVVYGGLAAAVGLAVWMNLSALVVLYGAAFNAEYRSPSR